jgi:hypothetical protein
MPTTNGNRPILDIPRWEMLGQTPTQPSIGHFFSTCPHHTQLMLFAAAASATGMHLYNPSTDGFHNIENPSLGGSGITFGSHGACTAIGPSGTASANGSTTTINTNLTLVRNLAGYRIHITSGPAAGDVRVIASNTIGANAVITVTTAFSASTTTATTYRLITPRWYVMSGGSTVATSFRYYDYALGTWTNASSNTLPFTPSNSLQIVTTPSWYHSDFLSFATGTATSAGLNTLSNSAKNWATNQWTNHQVRIVGGTGAGQIRTISANTGTQLTVSANWTTTPDATSTYSIEGNDDYLYVTGNAATATHRLTLSTGTWTTMGARAQATGNGVTAHWVWGHPSPAWTDENNILNGRYIYSFEGNSNSNINRYDIAANSWSTVTWSKGSSLTITTGSKAAHKNGHLYLYFNNSQRVYEFDCGLNEMSGYGFCPLNVTSETANYVAEICTYKDGATEIPYFYLGQNGTFNLMRMMILQ